MNCYQRQILDYRPICEQEERDRQLMLHYVELFPNTIGTRQCEMAHMTASSLIFNRDRRKLLMVYHNIYRSWSWTGGHADGEEKLLLTAVREAQEETGIKKVSSIREEMQSLEVLPVWGHFKRGQYVSAHLHLNVSFLLETDEEEALQVKEDENSGVAWFGLREAVEASSEPWFRERVYGKLNEKLRVWQVSGF